MTEVNKIIEETERLLAAGTQGDIRPARHDTSWGVESVFAWVGHEMSEPDARLFAAAPTALRALVDEVHRLRKQVVQLEFDRTTQPNADWQPNSKTVAPATLPEYPIRTCSQCRYFPDAPESDGQGEHHPACEHAPANPRNAGPRYRSPASYEGNAGDSDADPV